MSAMSTDVDNLEDVVGEGDGVEDAGLSDLLVGLSSTRGLCLTSLALVKKEVGRGATDDFVNIVVIGEVPLETELLLGDVIFGWLGVNLKLFIFDCILKVIGCFGFIRGWKKDLCDISVPS